MTDVNSIDHIEFNQQWEHLKANNSFQGKIDMCLPGTGVSAAKFTYPTGNFNVESSDHWGVGIVRRSFDVDYFVSGCVKYDRRTIYQGELVLSEPNSEFDAKLRGQGDIDYLVLSQERVARFLPSDKDALTDQSEGLAARMQSGLLACLVSASLDELNRNAPVRPLYLDAFVDAVLAELVRGIHGDCADGVQCSDALSDAALKKLTQFIRENMYRKIGLTDLAHCLGMTQTKLRRAMKARNGLTPYQLILNTRLQSAQTMLSATDASAAKIAFDCGFSSQSHMADMFRQKLGKTPGQVRATGYSLPLH